MEVWGIPTGGYHYSGAGNPISYFTHCCYNTLQTLGYVRGDITFFLTDPLLFCKTTSVARMNQGKSMEKKILNAFRLLVSKCNE